MYSISANTMCASRDTTFQSNWSMRHKPVEQWDFPLFVLLFFSHKSPRKFNEFKITAKFTSIHVLSDLMCNFEFNTTLYTAPSIGNFRSKIQHLVNYWKRKKNRAMNCETKTVYYEKKGSSPVSIFVTLAQWALNSCKCECACVSPLIDTILKQLTCVWVKSKLAIMTSVFEPVDRYASKWIASQIILTNWTAFEQQ